MRGRTLISDQPMTKSNLQEGWMLMVKTFGERLLYLRKLRGYTQNELARQLSVSQACINRYEHGQDKPGYEKLVQLLETTTDFLLGMTDCEKIPSAIDYMTPQQKEDMELKKVA